MADNGPALFSPNHAPSVATEAMKRDALQRELMMRRRAYPRFIDAGKMTKAKADHEIWLIEQILETGYRPELAS